jgi:hypothetical protein
MCGFGSCLCGCCLLHLPRRMRLDIRRTTRLHCKTRPNNGLSYSHNVSSIFGTALAYMMRPLGRGHDVLPVQHPQALGCAAGSGTVHLTRDGPRRSLPIPAVLTSPNHTHELAPASCNQQAALTPVVPWQPPLTLLRPVEHQSAFQSVLALMPQVGFFPD